MPKLTLQLSNQMDLSRISPIETADCTDKAD